MLSNNSESIEKSGMRIVANENAALASLYGRIDIDSSPAVRGRLLALFESPHPKIVSIDLSGVTHLDSSGVATLIEAKIARQCKRPLGLQGLNDRLHRLFEATAFYPLQWGHRNEPRLVRGGLMANLSKLPAETLSQLDYGEPEHSIVGHAA